MRLPAIADAPAQLVSQPWQSIASSLPPRKSTFVTYSRKVFIPLTRLCQDSCSYCTFAHHTGVPKGSDAYLTPSEVLEIARQGAKAGCTEALFTLGDRPELKWPAAREQLQELGFESTVEYLASVARQVLEETGLLPHTNPGVLRAREMALLREVSVSQGLMLESLAESLHSPGGPHAGCTTKLPAARLRTMALAGRLRVPFTTGLLLGIGESRKDTIDALLAIRHCHARFGHIQEVIIQPFRPKENTRLAARAALPDDELLWAVCAAKALLGPFDIPVQSPPNLSPGDMSFRALLRAGLDDFGGVSPGVTIDHVNPEARWPEVDALRAAVEAEGLQLVPRLPAYPRYVSHALLATRALDAWQSDTVAPYVRRMSDASGLARSELPVGWRWHAGLPRDESALVAAAGVDEDERWLPFGSEFERLSTVHDTTDVHAVADAIATSAEVSQALHDAASGKWLTRRQLEALLSARGADVAAICLAADAIRLESSSGSGVSFVVCRNINYTNKCTYRCTFCAFSKGHSLAKGAPYEIDEGEVSRRSAEAWARGATEVCMQGGIDPSYDGESYLAFLRAAKAEVPQIHVHAFSPLEVTQGAAASDKPTGQYLSELKVAGLGSLPGTAAEVLSDPVRAELCPDKLNSKAWLDLVGEAHAVGLPTTSTLMFGHCEGVSAVANHLIRLRNRQQRSIDSGSPASITEFVPLPFVHPEAPIYRMGGARPGPTLREAVLVHAVSRLALPNVPSIQTSWTKMGARGAAMALRAGANDLGGTLMSESISRAAGAAHGQEMTPERMREIIEGLPPDPNGKPRRAWQRTTLYKHASQERQEAAKRPAPLVPVELG